MHQRSICTTHCIAPVCQAIYPTQSRTQCCCRRKRPLPPLAGPGPQYHASSVQSPAEAATARAEFDRRQALVLLASTACLWNPQASTAQQAQGRQLTAEERAAVEEAFRKAAGKAKGGEVLDLQFISQAPVLLRLAFHDAATFLEAAGDGGANASVQFELKRPENTGLNRGWGVIEATTKYLQGTPASWLSRADVIALAGAYAVGVTGGPAISVPVGHGTEHAEQLAVMSTFHFDTHQLSALVGEGRIDASAQDPTGRLPDEKLSAGQLREVFAAKGLSTREFVALSGAHTLGSKGFGDPLTFDNTYYTTLLQRPWTDTRNSMASMIGLPSDHVLPDDPACADVIETYAKDQSAFFRDFSASYLKMTSMGAQWA